MMHIADAMYRLLLGYRFNMKQFFSTSQSVLCMVWRCYQWMQNLLNEKLTPLWTKPPQLDSRTVYFPDFLEQRDQKKVVFSRYRQFGKLCPVSSCLVSFKTSSGTRTSNNQSLLLYFVYNKWEAPFFKKQFIYSSEKYEMKDKQKIYLICSINLMEVLT